MTMRKVKRLAPLACVLVAASAAAATIPVRPEQIAFPPMAFNVPDAAALRVQLANGVPVYIAEDKMLPLVTVQVLFRGGGYLEPAGKEGVAQLTGTVWRTGGAGSLDAQALDEELDFLAAQLSTSVGDTSGTVTLNLLAKDVDRGLALLVDVLRNPRFDEARLAKAKEDLIAEMKRRNDDTADIEEREWDRLVYGDACWINRLPTRASVDAITRDELVAFHRVLANPANFVVAVAGDFDRAAMVARLDATLGAWRAGGAGVPPVPQPVASAKPGVYVVNKPGVNQGRVSIGHLGAVRPLPDEFALVVANDILGGGGFSAWMTQRVRSDEGLAYSAYSSFGIGDRFPGTFRAYFQSKSATCAWAAKLTVDLIARIRSAEVSAKELDASKSALVERFPRVFEGKLRTVSRFAEDELVGRPHEYWSTYRQNVNAVTQGAVLAAAKAHIAPDRLIMLVVGNAAEILKGQADHPEANFSNFGPIVPVPLRDPLTLAPVPE